MTQNKKSTRYFSKKQENTIAKLLNGKTVANSGATPYNKGDVESFDDDSWFIECKTCMTNKLSFSIKKDWLRVAKQQAINQGKYNYALAFNYGPDEPNYFIIDEKKFKELVTKCE